MTKPKQSEVERVAREKRTVGYVTVIPQSGGFPAVLMSLDCMSRASAEMEAIEKDCHVARVVLVPKRPKKRGKR